MTGPEPTTHRTSHLGVATVVNGLLAAILIVYGMLNFGRGHSLFGLGLVVGGAGFVLAALGAFRREARWRVTAIACWLAAVGLLALWQGMK